MIEIERYNASLVSKNLDISCYGFAIAINQGQKAFRDEFAKELQSALSTFYTALKTSNAMSAGPMTLKHFKASVPHPEYHVEKVVGFPYRIGIVTYVNEGKKYFHMGLVVESGERIYA